MGGGLLQQCDRDTLKFAMKCSSVGIKEPCGNGSEEDPYDYRVVWRDVFKDPATDPGKASKKGRVVLFESGGEYVTDVEEDLPKHWTDRGTDWKNCMETYFENGEVKFTQTFEQVRANSNK
jgi:nicotinamide phosphoribosyltransferase